MNRPEFVHFLDLGPDHVNRDFQIHTQATDGEATIVQIIAQADRLGLREIAFTEHVRKTSDYYSDFVKQVQDKRDGSKVQVYVGIEAKALDAKGTLDVSKETLDQAQIVLGAVHRFPAGDGRFVRVSELTYHEAVEQEFALAMGMIAHGPMDVLSHPGGMCLHAFGRFPEEKMEALMRASLDRGIAIEINTAYNPDLDGFLRLCRKVNPIVSVGSDVHGLDQLGTCRNALWQRGIGCR